MNDLYDRFGYFTWKYSKDLWALCGSNEYIWIYKNHKALMKEVNNLKSSIQWGIHNHSTGGMSLLQIHGPCGVITIP